MSTALHILHWCASFIVLAEALNKLERTAPFRAGICHRTRLVDGLKALAWTLLALGAGGAVVAPILAAMGVQAATSQLMLHQSPSLSEFAVLVGFAVLVVRTRLKEG